MGSFFIERYERDLIQNAVKKAVDDATDAVKKDIGLKMKLMVSVRILFLNMLPLGYNMGF